MSNETRKIFCVGCDVTVLARLTKGAEIYPHRRDLQYLPFWKCDGCGNYVGCHHKTGNPTHPLGNIPTAELRQARQKIHATLDPLWKSGRFKRRDLYKAISDKIGREYHTAETTSVAEVECVLATLNDLPPATIGAANSCEISGARKQSSTNINEGE